MEKQIGFFERIRGKILGSHFEIFFVDQGNGFVAPIEICFCDLASLSGSVFYKFGLDKNGPLNFTCYRNRGLAIVLLSHP